MTGLSIRIIVNLLLESHGLGLLDCLECTSNDY